MLYNQDSLSIRSVQPAIDPGCSNTESTERDHPLMWPSAEANWSWPARHILTMGATFWEGLPTDYWWGAVLICSAGKQGVVWTNNHCTTQYKSQYHMPASQTWNNQSHMIPNSTYSIVVGISHVHVLVSHRSIQESTYTPKHKLDSQKWLGVHFEPPPINIQSKILFHI